MKQINAAAREFDQVQNLLEQLSSAVVQQLTALKTATASHDASELKAIVQRDREIDTLELALDRTARSFMELRAPLGPDFRAMMAAVDIARNLERIGDCVEYVARHVSASLKMQLDFPEGWQVITAMIDKCLHFLSQAHTAWAKGDARMAERLPREDEEVDALQKQTRVLCVDAVRAGKVDVALGLEAVLIANKLESIADISSHIAESVVFVIQARQIRHEKRKELARTEHEPDQS